MARLLLNPVQFTGPVPTNLTTALTAAPLGSSTGVYFTNTGRELLFVSCSGASTCTVNIGTAVEGELVAAETPTLPSTGTLVFGEFRSDFNQTGVNAGQVWIDFGTPANISVLLLQHLGVF
jgi:hypothetical protein